MGGNFMNAAQTYQEMNITTQGKGRLIVMLYDGAIKFLNQALNCLQNGDYERKGDYVVKAQDIIFELNTVLDMEMGGQISQNLRKLYNYMWQRLSEANIKNDQSAIQEVISLLSELNKGWKAVAKQQG
jgi:flagellar protein FliS